MNRTEINDIYEESVWQIRLRVAIGLLSVPNLNPDQCLAEADKFVELLQKESKQQLMDKFK
jgi:hypothetical protein